VSVVGELLAGRYELEELSGSGGMSRVYRARDRQLGRLVAIKVLHERYADDPAYVDRFRREARAVARLSHPNIVTIIDRGEADGSQYIVFEHVDGENLKQLVARVGPLPVRRVLDLAIDVARALAFAHANGVVHRDVKPQNVLLPDGGAKVTDFGIARADDLELGSGDTEVGTVLGTADYISPEQARGERATELSDEYSLGVLVFELLTGHVPYPADSAVAAAARHATDPVPDVLTERPDVPVRLAMAVERALAKAPADRFPSMDALLAELVTARKELPALDAAQTMILSQAPPPRVAVTEQLPVRRNSRWPLVALLVLLLVAVAGGAAYLVYSHGQTPASSGGSPPPAAASTVQLTATTAYDPSPGNGAERNDLLHLATDGSTATSWQTEHYTTAAFGNLKQGVGIVVSTGNEPVKLGSLTVDTPTPGFKAEVEAGDSEHGPFDVVSSDRTVGSKTTFALHVSEARRFYMVWLTELVYFDTGDPVHHYGARISEITGT
jgi:eukaryotic-like serine/threonine-protein kinase